MTELVSNDIGVASMMLGARRLTKEDDIDLAVGIVLNKKIGDNETFWKIKFKILIAYSICTLNKCTLLMRL